MESIPDANGAAFSADAGKQESVQEDDQAYAIATDPTLTFSQKVDRLAEVRNWFAEDSVPIEAYLSGVATKEATVDELVASIEHLYSTAEEGRAYYQAEGRARNQRQHYAPEKALEMWGAQESWAKPPVLPEGQFHPSCGGKLWSLWYSVLHAAKKIAWDSSQQQRLVELVQTIKERPNPPQPSPMTVPLSRDWVLGGKDLWTSLTLLGPSARETWNDSPGCGAGWLEPEVAAWVNVNAFVARLTSSGVSDFRTYGMWALRDALEEQVDGGFGHQSTSEVIALSALLRTAVVWIKVAGETMYKTSVDGHRDVDTRLRDRDLPWNNPRTDAISLGRWKFWKVRFEEESRNLKLDEEVRKSCSEAASIIASLHVKVRE